MRKITKKDCVGCGDNFYNGNNNLGIKECWCFEDAKMVKRISIGLWEPPPYKNKKEKLIPSCFHGRGNQRNIYIKKEVLDHNGYWKLN